MKGTTLAGLLAASLDANISTQALRLAARLRGEVGRKLLAPGKNKEPRTEAYLSWEQVADHTGVWSNDVTIRRHLGGLNRVGLVEYLGPGNHAIEDNHGMAGTWTLTNCRYAGLEPVLTSPEVSEEDLGAFLDPANDCWTRARAGNRGYRAMLAIVALHGTGDAVLTGPQMAAILGLERTNGSAALRELEKESLLVREGRRFRTFWPFFAAVDEGFFLRRAERNARSRERKTRWLAQRAEFLGEPASPADPSRISDWLDAGWTPVPSAVGDLIQQGWTRAQSSAGEFIGEWAPPTTVIVRAGWTHPRKAS